MKTHITLDDFLDAAMHAEMLRAAIAEEAQFTPARVSTGDAAYRRARVYGVPLPPLFREKLLALLPGMMAARVVAPFKLGLVEGQITAHNDGDYFKSHNDNGSPDTATRMISYIYYFFGKPQRFSGGALRMHGRHMPPVNNRLLLFSSHIPHEVLPVQCPSKQFADSRFTLNGWIRRA